MATVSSNILKETELITNHRNLVQAYLKKETNWKLSIRKKLLQRYDEQINKENIRFYLNRHVKLFIIALAQDELKAIAKYFPKGYAETN